MHTTVHMIQGWFPVVHDDSQLEITMMVSSDFCLNIYTPTLEPYPLCAHAWFERNLLIWENKIACDLCACWPSSWNLYGLIGTAHSSKWVGRQKLQLQTTVVRGSHSWWLIALKFVIYDTVLVMPWQYTVCLGLV